MAQLIKLNVTPGSVPPVANCSQCDVGREIQFSLYNGSSTFSIPSGSTVYVHGTKHDGHPFGYDSVNEPQYVTYSGSIITLKTSVQMTAAAGRADCEFSIETSSSQIYTANFVLDVETMAWPQDKELSTIDVPLIVKAANAENYATQAANSASTASSKASAAATSASTATSKASAAASSASNAATSEKNAKTSETNAKASQTAAKTSETNAASSAKLSQSWAVGGTKSRTGEDTNNSKYFAQQAEAYAGSAAAAAGQEPAYRFGINDSGIPCLYHYT